MTANGTEPAAAVFMPYGALHCTPCSTAAGPANLSTMLDGQHDGAGGRGYADLDDSSATACASCAVGTYAAAAGAVECADFDECASAPCLNGASCQSPTLGDAPPNHHIPCPGVWVLHELVC